MEERLVSVEDASKLLYICRKEVYRQLQRGKLERRHKSDGKRGRPRTYVTMESIVNYIKKK